jgi:ABC-type multidrug transport system fused ATPase/permease subunit
MLLVMLLEMASIGYLIPLVDLFSSTQDNNYIANYLYKFLTIDDTVEVVVYALIIYAFIFLLKNLMSFFLFWVQARFSNLLKARMSKDLMIYYVRKPYEFHINSNSSELIRNAFSEVGTVVGAGIQPILQIMAESLVIIGLLLILISVEPTGTLIAMTIAASGLYLIFHFLKSYLYRWGKDREYHDGKRIKHIQQSISSVKDIKIFGGESEFMRQYHYHNLQAVFSTIKQSSIQQLPRLIIESLVVILIVIYITKMVYSGSSVKDMSSVIAIFAVSALRLMPSANRIVTALQSIRYGMPVLETIYSDLNDYKNNYSLEDADNGSEFISLKFNKEISIRNLSYSYLSAEHQVVLSDVTLTINKGDRIAIIGKSGSGKSTLINIILGLLDQSSGSIKVDGIDIRPVISLWRKKLSYVPQDIFLLDDTIARNIAFGIDVDDIDYDRLRAVIKQSQLQDVIEQLPKKIDTMVGERGVRFSGGQRQRIGLARALYHNPEILVLDEATSSLDIGTEKNIMSSIYDLDQNLTIIIVTHRESTIYGCNKVVFLENGMVRALK